MSYRILLRPKASSQLTSLPSEIYSRVKQAIVGLASDPRPLGSRKLRSREGWRLRIGDYRVLYRVEDAERTVTILYVAHRREVYR
jgi:mRNA interferase RelE/StbE